MLVFQTMLGIGAGVLNAQTVKGTVISGSDNEPLIGASVMVQVLIEHSSLLGIGLCKRSFLLCSFPYTGLHKL